MKYTVSNTINAPLDKVIEHFKGSKGTKHWMEALRKKRFQIRGEWVDDWVYVLKI